MLLLILHLKGSVLPRSDWTGGGSKGNNQIHVSTKRISNEVALACTSLAINREEMKSVFLIKYNN